MNDAAKVASPKTTIIQTIILALGVFGFDIKVSIDINACITYVVVILVALNVPDPRYTVRIAIACAGLTLARIYFGAELSDEKLIEVLTNRFLAIFGFWIVAAIGLERKRSEDAVRKAREELEQRVVERTLELVKVNEDLQIEASAHDQAVQAGREIEDRTSTIIDHALDAIVAIDNSGAVVTWNPQAEFLFGWKRHEALGEMLADMIVPESQREAHSAGIERFSETGEGTILNKRLAMKALHRDGHEFDVELSINPVPWGESVLFSAFIREASPDATKREQATSADAAPDDAPEADTSADEGAAEEPTFEDASSEDSSAS